MKPSARKTVSAFALGALFFASLAGVCTTMMTACGTDCSGHAMATMANAGVSAMAADCLTAGPACVAFADHMTTFAESFPSVAAKTLLLLLSGIAVIVFWRTVRDTDRIGNVLRVRLKNLSRRRSEPIVPEHLAHAFSNGILHSEIYA